jgi:hypothetical protein
MYILPLSKPFEIFMTSLGTQITLPRQFVECLDHIKMSLELLYHKILDLSSNIPIISNFTTQL